MMNRDDRTAHFSACSATRATGEIRLEPRVAMIEGAQAPDRAPAAPARARAGRLGQYSAFTGLAVGAFMGPLDGSMVNSMLPILTRELGVDISTTEWLLT